MYMQAQPQRCQQQQQTDSSAPIERAAPWQQQQKTGDYRNRAALSKSEGTGAITPTGARRDFWLACSRHGPALAQLPRPSLSSSPPPVSFLFGPSPALRLGSQLPCVTNSLLFTPLFPLPPFSRGTCRR